MSKKPSVTGKSQAERLEKAVRRLERIQKKIAPFAPKMEIVQYSTAGKWQIPDTTKNPKPLSSQSNKK